MVTSLKAVSCHPLRRMKTWEIWGRNICEAGGCPRVLTIRKQVWVRASSWKITKPAGGGLPKALNSLRTLQENLSILRCCQVTLSNWHTCSMPAGLGMCVFMEWSLSITCWPQILRTWARISSSYNSLLCIGTVISLWLLNAHLFYDIKNIFL